MYSKKELGPGVGRRVSMTGVVAGREGGVGEHSNEEGNLGQVGEKRAKENLGGSS